MWPGIPQIVGAAAKNLSRLRTINLGNATQGCALRVEKRVNTQERSLCEQVRPIWHCLVVVLFTLDGVSQIEARNRACDGVPRT